MNSSKCEANTCYRSTRNHAHDAQSHAEIAITCIRAIHDITHIHKCLTCTCGNDETQSQSGHCQPRLKNPIMRLDVFLDEDVPDFPFAKASVAECESLKRNAERTLGSVFFYLGHALNIPHMRCKWFRNSRLPFQDGCGWCGMFWWT